MFKFREYQWRIIDKATDIVKKYRFIYLAMEVRTGKTLTSLGLAQSLDCKEVLFVTKKKAISSIEADYALFNLNNATFSLSVINYESLHKIDQEKN